jgi:Secretion system C-terminal sorting domain
MRKGFLLMALSLAVSASLAFAQGDYQRKVVTVPKVDPAAITIDGNMDEPAWATGGKADMVTSAGFEIFTNKYFRESLTEPDYDEMYARLLWAKDTLYVFMHIDEFVDDSTNLFWGGQWTGDQLFISLSNRLAVDMVGNYDGNVYAAPDGPYHFLIMGPDVTLNAGGETGIPEEYRRFPDDTVRVFDAAAITRWATFIDTLTGVWNVEMAIYQPSASADARIGFNIGGSTGSAHAHATYGDAYAYFTWQPAVIDSPYAQPPAPEESDPGFYNLADAETWALLELAPSGPDGVDDRVPGSSVPASFALNQNYPNPFNPSTRVSFDVPRSAKITLTVYNLLGQKVATLVNERLAAGRHETTWNARNLPSGMYIMHMQADGSFTSSMKLMLLK